MKNPLILAVILSTLFGCSHIGQIRLYAGPVLPEYEESTLILPEEFEVLELNGQSISDSRLRFRSGDIDLKLPAGEHVLVLQYKAFWQIDDDNHDIVSSGPITFKVNLQKQETFTVQFPEIKQYQDALAFSEKPQLTLVSSSQKIPGSAGSKDNAMILIEHNAPTSTSYPNLDQLKFWWNRATYYEQNEFLNWQKKDEHPSN